MHSRLRILITGSSGMLGNDIKTVLISGNKYDVFEINRTCDKQLPKGRSIICDITNHTKVNQILDQIKPDVIIHCAALVDVEECESNKEKAMDVNVNATENLAKYNSSTVKFIYISTDSVFNGQTGGYSEEAEKEPLNYYACTKSNAEDIVRNLVKESLILRTNIYGYHKNGGKSLVEWALENFEHACPISGFDDVFFNPVYTKQLARIIMQLIEMDYKGILNVGSSNCISKYDFLLKVANEIGFDANCISRTSIDSVGFDAIRPKNTTLSVAKLCNILPDCRISVEEGIRELIKDYMGRQ